MQAPLPSEFLASIKKDRELASRLAGIRVIEPEDGSYKEPARPLPPQLAEALKSRGLSKLYRHQAEALDVAREGKHLAVVTPTASGKTLTCLLPILERLLQNPEARSLFLYPIKALARDQLGEFQEWLGALGPSPLSPLPPVAGEGKARPKKTVATPPSPLLSPTGEERGALSWEGGEVRAWASAGIYDGDTSPYRRKKMREDPPQLLLSNPDMLHLSFLPHHGAWGKFLSKLEFVVIDEAHCYRGVFGAHVAFALRRLRRLCEFYGSKPLFLFLSATIANPAEFTERLLGEPVRVVADNGAPRSRRTVALWNPEGSPYGESSTLFSRLVTSGFKTIAFTKARKITELMYRWSSEQHPELKSRIAAYRAGYLPEERRALEARLFSGELDGVIATSALELGIDVGGLDACVLAGFPGTMISARQRMGRVGRGDRESLVFLVGLQDALDQYFMRHPEAFFDRVTERALLPIDNPVVLASHYACAAAELPLGPADKRWFGPRFQDESNRLWKEGVLRQGSDGLFHSSRPNPQRDVNLRSSGESFAIVAEGKGQKLMGTLDVPRVYRDGHPGAIYLHQGAQYEVLALDEAFKRVRVREVEADYYTEPRGEDNIEILEVTKRADFGHVEWCFGRVRATEQVKGFVRKHIGSQKVLDEHDLEMPPHVFETRAVWWVLPSEWRKEFALAGLDFAGSIHALEHSQIALLPVFASCDRWDLGGVSYWSQPQLDKPCVFVYDAQAGGAALAEQGFEVARDWLKAVENLLKECPCEEGCPACVQSPKCGNGNKPLDKKGALELAQRLIKRLGDSQRPPSPLPPPAGEERGAVSKTGGEVRVEAPKPSPLSPSIASPLSPLPPVAVEGKGGEPGNVVVFDLETQFLAAEVGGWDNKAAMKLSVAVTWSSKEGKFRQYTEGQVGALMEQLKNADLVVGFNIKNFDYEVLRPYAPGFDFGALPTLDLLEEVAKPLGHRLKLESLATATLNAGKGADGLQAVAWWREGKLAELLQYCQRDVEITRDLWEFGAKQGYLLYTSRDGLMKVPALWGALPV